MQVQFLGWEDPLEEELATHSSILAWKSLLAEEPSGLRSMESQRDQHSSPLTPALLNLIPSENPPFPLPFLLHKPKSLNSSVDPHCYPHPAHVVLRGISEHCCVCS